MSEVSEAPRSAANGHSWRMFDAGGRPAGINPRALRRTLNFMESHLSEHFTLQALASNAGISRFHFARLFRAATGHSPMMYLTHLRVQRGKCLLERGGASICEIAAFLGFCDQSHFTRTFRKVTGMCPRDYAAKFSASKQLGTLG